MGCSTVTSVRPRSFLHLFAAVGFALLPAVAVAQAPPAQSEIPVREDATVEQLFTDFLHYARLGRFTTAEAYAEALLAHPQLDPIVVMEAANKERESVKTLMLLIKHTDIGPSAARVLELIEEGEQAKRRSADRIIDHIRGLGGDPQQEYYALQRLAESGEYAVPYMIQTLLDPNQKALWPRVVNALPKIGKPAINPLVQALDVNNDAVRNHIIEALGRIGYPQAIPYLKKLVTVEDTPEPSREAARTAVDLIESTVGRSYDMAAPDSFFWLGERYYNEDDAVRADPRLDEANVWYWDDNAQALSRVAVPTRIFGQIMAMRCCEEALRLRPDYGDATGLWLAGNIRRESRLGLDVESGEPVEQTELDPTRPDDFPRALYFTQAAGARYAHMVLGRAVRQLDSPVALGAIAGLDVTAGPASLVGPEDFKQPLVSALQFPDVVVRTRAALALGGALPPSGFVGADRVMPVLAAALTQTGREQVLVIESDQNRRNRVAGALRDAGSEVVAAGGFLEGMERARQEFTHISGVFIATDISSPGVSGALAALREEAIFAKTPVVILVGPQQEARAAELSQADPYVETVDALADDASLTGAFDRVRARTGQTRLAPDTALEMALEASDTLRTILVHGRTVFDVAEAEPALIQALSSRSEELQVRAASVLALLPTATAQRSIAHVAMENGNTDSLRIAAFGSLAESARFHGNMLESAQVTRLVEQARNEPDLTLRTAASRALGALNLTNNQASEIIRGFHQG